MRHTNLAARNILFLVLKIMTGLENDCGVDLSGLGLESVAGRREHGNDISVSVKETRNFLVN